MPPKLLQRNHDLCCHSEAMKNTKCLTCPVSSMGRIPEKMWKTDNKRSYSTDILPSVLLYSIIFLVMISYYCSTLTIQIVNINGP